MSLSAIASLSPSVPYGHLEQFTELVVSPKLREGGELPAAGQPSPAGGAADPNQSPRLHRQKNFEVPESPQAPPPDSPESRQGGVWAGVSHLKSLVRSMLAGSVSPEREVPSVPSIPCLLRDGVFRVCRPPPVSVGPQGALHVLPWGHCHDEEDRSPAAVAYGRVSRLRSAREQRERAKQTSEKKRGSTATDPGEGGPGSDEAQEKPLVVKLVCHCVEQILDLQNESRGRRLYSGRVWVSTPSELPGQT